MIIDCISDLHGHFPKLEGGDLLIIAGDLTAQDTFGEYLEFLRWLRNQDYKKKIFISGNHDGCLVGQWPGETKGSFRENEGFYNFDYLLDSGTEFSYCIDGYPEEDEKFLPSGHRTLKIWGSPWTKRFEGMNPHCMAFTVDTEEELAEKWEKIPRDIDILITHSPSQGVLDEVQNYEDGQIESVGSSSLIKPMIKSGCRLHVFGHIHEGYGKFHNRILGITYVNASHVDKRYRPVNKPIRVEL